MKRANINTINRFVPRGASLNSFHTNTPQSAATMVAPWPNPYEMANPACPEAMMLNIMPIPQMMPPKTPTAWRGADPPK